MTYEDKSFWLASYGPYAPNAPLQGDLTVDVAVIGGGFTGLSTAYHLRKENPGMRVAVLESHVIGFGASGRNAGFSMTLFGLEATLTKAFFGAERTVEAHRYMERAVDYVHGMIQEHAMQSDYEFTGLLRVATNQKQIKRIHHNMEVLTSLGIKGIEWIDADKVRAEADSPLFLGAWWEPRTGIFNPAKQVRELKRVATEAGATIFEETPVTAIERGAKFTLKTPGGVVTADKIVLATNAYSHLIPMLRSRQAPAFTHVVVTEPLDESRLGPIGWKHRQGIEDMRNLIHYFRLTADNRLLIGGSDVSLAFGKKMEYDMNSRVFADLQRQVVRMFPSLKGVNFTHQWGGPISATVELVPSMGFVGDERAVFSLGCIGHGVSMTHLNGKTLADLLVERKTDLTDVWFVNRRAFPWPPEPVRYLASQGIRGFMRIADAWDERGSAANAPTSKSDAGEPVG